MVYDNRGNRIILFGGKDASDLALGDTWEWSAGAWTQLFPSTAPSPRYDHAMAYDRRRQRIVLFGGRRDEPCGAAACAPCATGDCTDTWELDGASWAQKANDGVDGRHGHDMASTGGDSDVLLFGGTTASSPVAFGDTWGWDGGFAARPGQTLAFSLDAMDTSEAIDVRSIVATFVSGGIGGPGQTTGGAEIVVWLQGSWVSVGASASNSPAPFDGVVDAPLAGRVAFGPNRTVTFGVRPQGANDDGVAQVETDFARVRVTYTRP